MKTSFTLSLFCAFWLLVNSASAQMKIITLDFASKSFNEDFEALKTLKPGQLYQLKIININMNLFNVMIDKQDSTLVSDVPFPTLELIGLDGVSTIAANIIQATTSTTEKISQWGFENEKQRAPGKETAQERILLIQYNYLINLNSTLSQSKPVIGIADGLIVKINNQLLSYMVGVDTLIRLSHYVFDPNLTFDQAMVQATSLRKQIDSLKDIISSQQTAYNKFAEGLLKSDETKKLITEDSLIKLNDQRLKEGYTKAIAELTAAADKISYVKISGFFASLIRLENNKNRTYLSMPMQLNGDINKLTLTISPKVADAGLQSYNATYEFPRKSFYVGLGASFYYAKFRNDFYSIKETQTSDTTSHFNLIEENPERREIGFASLIHFGWKLNRVCNRQTRGLFGIHGTLGPALSLSSKPQFRMAVGAGISLGRNRNMLTLDFLRMGGYVNRLSNAYSMNEDYSAKPEQVTVSKLDFQWSYSVGYIYKF